jgi:hypothetical protein
LGAVGFELSTPVFVPPPESDVGFDVTVIAWFCVVVTMPGPDAVTWIVCGPSSTPAGIVTVWVNVPSAAATTVPRSVGVECRIVSSEVPTGSPDPVIVIVSPG